ncbi:MAG: hypothetical protein AB9869_25255 [Verrucomicrobiia bacterium]
MNKHYQNAAQRLHKFAADDADCTEAELRAELSAQGVNVEAFLARLSQESGIKPSTATAKKPTASERLRAIASRAGEKVKGLLGELNTGDGANMPAAAYGRSSRRSKRSRSSPRGKRGGKTGN